MSSLALVSIIVPTYNRVLLLKETLYFIQQQTYTNWECLVIDDGSTDNTEALINEQVKDDSRFKLVKRPKSKTKGAPTCRNIGLQEAKGDYILFFDSDDILLPHVLESRMSVVLKTPEYPFHVFQTARFYHTIADSDAIWNDLSKPNTKDLESFLNINPVWHTSGPIWRQDFLMRHKLYFTEGVSSWQDWEFHIRVLLLEPDYLKTDSNDTRVFQRFHAETAINKLNTLEAQQHRIELFFFLIEVFKSQHRFNARLVHRQFFKLFYFVIQQMPYEKIDNRLWKRIAEELYLVPQVDLKFWSVYVHFNEQYRGKGAYTIYKLLKSLKKHLFNKRIPVTDFSDRTWYQIKSN